MSEENNDNLGDELKDKANEMADSAKEKADEMADSAKETFEEAKDMADDAAEDAKESASDFKEEAKSTVEDMKEGWNEATGSTENKKLIAGLLAIFLGSFGVHKFILGYNKEGIILLVASLVGYVTLCIGVGIFVLMATGAIGLIEGIIYLTKSDEEFHETYQVNQKPWF